MANDKYEIARRVMVGEPLQVAFCDHCRVPVFGLLTENRFYHYVDRVSVRNEAPSGLMDNLVRRCQVAMAQEIVAYARAVVVPFAGPDAYRLEAICHLAEWFVEVVPPSVPVRKSGRAATVAEPAHVPFLWPADEDCPFCYEDDPCVLHLRFFVNT